eukprot:767138-Pyramimonas_sp.AAC.1
MVFHTVVTECAPPRSPPDARVVLVSRPRVLCRRHRPIDPRPTDPTRRPSVQEEIYPHLGEAVHPPAAGPCDRVNPCDAVVACHLSPSDWWMPRQSDESGRCPSGAEGVRSWGAPPGVRGDLQRRVGGATQRGGGAGAAIGRGPSSRTGAAVRGAAAACRARGGAPVICAPVRCRGRPPTRTAADSG